jgi:CheY-like chemotaxis protein
MGALIDGVFHFTKLDSAAQGLTKTNCELSAVLADVKESIGELVRERRATVTSGALPAVQGNRVQLNQILQNLIVNAIRHTAQEPHVHVEAVDEGDRWQLRVSDNGPGIEEAQRVKIFEPFKRLTTQSGGLGLGLAICKRIVELHGGKIWVEAASSGGAAFCFTLPKATATAQPVAQAASDTQQAASATEQAQGALANVLIVDDSEADLELTRIMLVEEGHMRCNLHVARGAKEALSLIGDKLADAGLDLILLDINMPGIDGFELLKKLREQEALKNLPVVMCTTSGYDKDMDQAKALGATGYVTKPADLTKLRPTLAALANLRLAQEQSGYALLRAA